jgi:ribosome-interacting GTPase 1
MEKAKIELSGQLKAAKSKMKEAEKKHKKTSDVLEAAKSKVSELEEKIRELERSEGTPSQPSSTGHNLSTQGSSNVSRKLFPGKGNTTGGGQHPEKNKG